MLINTFHIQVDVVCPSRMPEFFLITLMSGSETTRHYQRDFTISAPPNVDVCTIRPRISAGNSAGTSPIETVVVGKFLLAFTINPRIKLSCLYTTVCLDDNTDSTTASTITVTTASSSSSGSEGNSQQGNSTTLIGKVYWVCTSLNICSYSLWLYSNNTNWPQLFF